jgi:RNA recognition motif-containing protein
MASAYCLDTLATISTLIYKESCVNIFVGNLAFSATENDLRQLFEPYGAVEKIQVVTDRETGRSRGFGFVEMPDSRAAKAAIEGLQGKQLAGRTLTVNEAKPREPRRAPRQPRW